jgi:hypothetical protein
MGVRRLLLDQGGGVLFSSPAGDRPIVAADSSKAIRVFHIASQDTNVYGVTVTVKSAGSLLVQVLEDLSHRDVLIDDIVTEFLTQVGWITAPILLILLIIDVFIFRRALSPIITASALAERIGPHRAQIARRRNAREVMPLVER